MAFETLTVHQEGSVLFVDIAAPPLNLLGPELVRDLVSLIQGAVQHLVRLMGRRPVLVVMLSAEDYDAELAEPRLTSSASKRR